MFKGMSKFQMISIGVFALFIVGGMAAFSLYKGSRGTETPPITIWGTIPSGNMYPYIQQVMAANGNKIHITYVQKNTDTFDAVLIDALAAGKGPDVILVSQDQILKHRDKIYPLSYNTLSEAAFKSAFVQETEFFLSRSGILAVPFSIDPMVMYWNRDLFSNASLGQAPKYWDEFLTLAGSLTKRDGLTITQSTVSLGEYRNVEHAKDILSLLAMQAGAPVVVEGMAGYQAIFSSPYKESVPPVNTALTFYTQFADPLKDIYSWNRSLPNSKDLFISNKLAVYFGYASEYSEIRGKNPNLNFDVAMMPQPRNSNNTVPKMTFGRVFGYALMRSSKNLQTAYSNVVALTAASNLGTWSVITGLPSVRRDMVMTNSGSTASLVFSTSALQARGWLDPDRSATDVVFKNMIEGITSGRKLFSEAVGEAQIQIQQLLDVVNQNN